jgi:hypothetical protein
MNASMSSVRLESSLDSHLPQQLHKWDRAQGVMSPAVEQQIGGFQASLPAVACRTRVNLGLYLQRRACVWYD